MKCINLNKRIVLLIFLCLFACYSFGQENYLKGYIVLPGGDTLHGFIDYRNWGINPNNISFKESLSSEKINYTPLNIEGFRVLDECYESGIFKTEISPTSTNNLNNDAQLQIKIDTSFLQTIIRGEKSLYYYKNTFGKEQFYIKIDTTYELLIYKRYIKNQATNDVIIENKMYLNQLVAYLNNCQTIQPKIKGLAYKKESLKKLFLTYYECTKSKIEFLKSNEKITVETGILSGLSLNPAYSSSSSTGSEDIESSANMSIGLFLNFVFPRNQRKWSICTELIYAPHNENSHTIVYQHPDVYTVTDENSKYIMFKVNNMLRFQYPIKKTFIFFNFGISSGYGIQKMSYRKTEEVFHSIDNITEENDISNYSAIEQGLNYGLGLKYKRFSIQARVESISGYFQFPTFSSDSRYYIMLGYRF